LEFVLLLYVLDTQVTIMHIDFKPNHSLTPISAQLARSNFLWVMFSIRLRMRIL
jgi:hypothetical protein